MKTFTVRDLDRSPAKVLAAAEHDGVARVRTRDGRIYSLRPEKPSARVEADWVSFAQSRRAKLKKLFPEASVLTPTEAKEFDRLLASDGPLL